MNPSEKKLIICIILLAIIAGNSYLIISETAGYFSGIGKTSTEAWLFSSVACLGALIMAAWKPPGRYQTGFKWLLIIAIEGGMISAAAIHTGTPLIESRLTGPTAQLAESYKSQLETIRAELGRLADSARDFGQKNPVNLSRIETERKILRGKEALAASDYNKLLQSASVSKTGLATLSHIIFWRVIIGIMNLFMAVILREQLQPQSIANNRNSPQSEPQADATMPQMSAKQKVKAVKEGAKCKSISGGKEGPFTVSWKNTELGRGANTQKAWEAAANNLFMERRAA